MGCDIHTHAERKVGDRYEKIEGLEPFDWRAYGMYGFLAGVRNYSDVTPIAQPRGIPADASAPVQSNYTLWGVDAHSASWLDVRELADFDYEQPMEDRRYTGMDPRGFMNGALTAKPGEGTATTYREFLGEGFFEDLEKLSKAGADRIVFWFDN